MEALVIVFGKCLGLMGRSEWRSLGEGGMGDSLKVGYLECHRQRCQGRTMQPLLGVETGKQAGCQGGGHDLPLPSKTQAPQNLCVIDSPCLLSLCDLPAE